MRVEQFLSDSATRFGKRPAVVAAGRQHSYAELGRSANRVAAALAARGIGRGDRVALFMDDNFAAVVSAFAVLKAGAIAAPIEPSTDTETLAKILRYTGVAAIVTEARLASVAAAAMANVRSIRLVLLSGGDRSTASASCLIFEEVAGGIGASPDIMRAGPASDLALVLQANESDGRPGEAGLTHTQIIAAAAAAPDETRTLSSILSYHGLCQLLGIVRAGATLVLETPSAFRLALASRVAADGDLAVLALAG